MAVVALYFKKTRRIWDRRRISGAPQEKWVRDVYLPAIPRIDSLSERNGT